MATAGAINNTTAALNDHIDLAGVRKKERLTALQNKGDINKMTINELKQAIASEKPRSAWGLGVKVYAEELAEELAEAIQGGYFTADKLTDRAALKHQMLNGAANWSEYSWGGCSLVYDGDIARRLCTPSEYGRSRAGERRPSRREEWLDTQARALNQAANMIIKLAREV